MKNITSVLFGFVLGTIVTGIVVWNIMPGMMLQERLSPYGIEETVNKIKENAVSKGWAVPSVKPLHKSILKHDGSEVEPVMLVNLCQPNHAFNILNEDDNKKISVFMPCTISVFQKSDGKTYIGNMNAGLLGSMFGGTVAEVIAEVSFEQQEFIEFAN